MRGDYPMVEVTNLWAGLASITPKVSCLPFRDKIDGPKPAQHACACMSLQLISLRAVALETRMKVFASDRQAQVEIEITRRLSIWSKSLERVGDYSRHSYLHLTIRLSTK